ncbi:hypothetical protein PG984_012297 [Apiospora sp. TS-2023a]
MGGQIFASGPNPLYTPRMPPGIYQHVKAKCHEKLKQLFDEVATPIEGPGKEDFGDIDFLVHGRSDATDPPFDSPYEWQEAVQIVLGAERRFSQQAQAASFAISWPTKILQGVFENQEASSPKDEPRYIQVDVHVCDTPETFRWSVFKQDHGDLWNLLGSTIRPYGLTIDHEALYKAKIHLTSDPDTVLQFLGLDGQRWTQPFASMEETYEYAATCRFFYVDPKSADEAGPGDDKERIEGAYTKQNLKSNDRQRMNKRPMFSNWINCFIPRCREKSRFANCQATREGTLKEALDQFGARKTYEARILEFQGKRQADTIWKDVIKATIPTDGVNLMFRGGAANGLKKIILHGDDSFGVVPSEPLKDETTGLFDEAAVRRFTEAHWKEVGDIVFQRNHEKLLAKKAKDSENEAEQEEED